MGKSKLPKNMNIGIEDEENIDFDEYEDLTKEEVFENENLLIDDTNSLDEIYGFIPLDIAKQAKINLYAFLYYKFTNEELRKNTRDIIAKLINESLGNIANTGQIEKYYKWDKHLVISEIGFNLLQWLDEYNPYYKKGQTIPFIPFFRKQVNLHLKNEFNKRKKEEERFVSTNDLSAKNLGTIKEIIDEEWNLEENSYAYQFIQCLYSLCNANNFKKFYEKNRKGVDETRKPYFKMFMTGDVISLIKNCDYDDFYKFVLPSQEKFANELEDGFIDFVYIAELIDHCFNNLRETDLKTYGELGFEVSENSTKSLPNERLNLPFQHNVYAKYMNKTEEYIHDIYYEKVRKNNGEISIIQGYKYFFNEFMGIREER